jgi:hypothetical protein
MSSCYHGVRAVTRFAAFAAQAGIQGLHQAGRDLLERYLARLHRELGGNRRALTECIGELNTFLLAIRRHGRDATLPASAMFFPEDYPKPGGRLPRALAAHVMAQVEDSANLERWRDRSAQPVTFASVATAAGISRSWLYTQADIRDQIHQLRGTRSHGTAGAIPASQRATETSLRARLTATLQRNQQLTDENTRLRRQLARALGDQRSSRTRYGNDPTP